MQSEIKNSLLVFIGWLIQASFQLDCIQCTSSIRHVSQNWDHSCLDGTLTALPCHQPINESETPYKQCESGVYRVSARGSAGVLIQRGCTKINDTQHGCDPPGSWTNFDSDVYFYCRRTCPKDGCNRHSVKEISSNANRLLDMKIYFICIIFLLFSACNFFLNEFKPMKTFHH